MASYTYFYLRQRFHCSPYTRKRYIDDPRSYLYKSCISLYGNPAKLAGKGELVCRLNVLVNSLLSCHIEQSNCIDRPRRRFGSTWISMGELRSSHFLGRRICVVSTDGR